MQDIFLLFPNSLEKENLLNIKSKSLQIILLRQKDLNVKKFIFILHLLIRVQNQLLKKTKEKRVIKINIREGRCQKIDNTFQQKGVDTLLTIDLSRIPKMEGIFDVIVLTSDTDFVPVINDLFEDKINVILAYFTDKKRKSGLSLSNHLWKACKDKIKIRKEYFLNK